MKYLVLYILLHFSCLHAGERYEFFNGVRTLGMGGATVAVTNDETALIANPAALGKLRDYFVTVADPELHLGQDTQRLVENDLFAFLDPQGTLDAAKNSPGKHFHQKAQVFPSFVVTNFGIGVLGNYTTNAATDAAASTYTYHYRNDFAAILGFNFRIWDGRIKLGANARLINRVEVDRTDIPVASTSLDFETDIGGTTIAKEGFGVASDVGLILTAPWDFLPSIAAVYRDVGNTRYNINEGFLYSTTERPETTRATLDVGFSIIPIIGKGDRMTITAEMVDVLDAMEPETEEASDEVMRRIHAGIEFNFSDVFFIRGGMNQGYWTAGLEVAVLNSQFQIATYGEEIADVVDIGSSNPYVKEEDRRYVAKFAYRF